MRRPSTQSETSTTSLRSVVDRWSWQEHARCRDHDLQTFFDGGEADEVSADSASQAKLICEDCPVRTECLNYALNAGERFGVWGGLSARERRHYKWFTNADPVDIAVPHRV
ncbi:MULTISPECIES: WhiB family transcriptional regulator [Nocardiaceae]|uniref:WhiB family transcriptional regulator n=1 Tax=Nocardiaceae TaxID=85025 RepID=UPI00195C8A3E|nr:MULTISPECIES: WhiB family transcriptional regulator [Rhodococcus]